MRVDGAVVVWRSPRAMSAVTRLILVLLFGSAALYGCDGSQACGDHVTASTAPGSPVIDRATVATQLAQDTWTVVLGVDFEDTDGDLGQGDVAFFLNDDSGTRSTQSLPAVFHESAVPVDATAGTLTVPLRFADTT